MNLQLTDELKSWCEFKSAQLGLSRNAFINLVLIACKNDDDLKDGFVDHMLHK